MTSTRRSVIIGTSLLLVVAFAGYLFLAVGSGRVARAGTSVGGVDIGGLAQDEAAAKVEKALGPLAGKRLRVRVLDSTFKVSPAQAGLGLDAAGSVAPAFARTWNPVTLVSAFLNPRELPALPAVDRQRLAAEVESIAQQVDQPATDPTLDLQGGEASVTPGTPGRVLDQDATMAAMTDAVLRPRAPVAGVVRTVEPTVTSESVNEAAGLARAAVSAPVTVNVAGVTARIPAEAIARALTFTSGDGTYTPVLDGEILHRSIADELSSVETPGRDATFRIRNGRPKVVPSRVGKGVSDDDLAAAVAGVIALPAGERNATVPVGVREPSLTTEQAKGLGVTEKLASFTQNFPYAAYRVQNIGQAAERINGTLLMPGEVFSLNDTILERTEANGYTVGFVVGPGGVFQEELGGGVSTSATATWTAAFYAGLERVQTVAHSIYISRYKPGLEATVAWGLFDLKFKNDTPNAVFITAGITDSSITVSMWGTKQYDSIEAEYGPRRDIVPFEKVYDDSPDCNGQNGVDGFTITVDRVFYKDGQEVRREPITTRYKPAPDVTCGKDPDKKGGKKDKKGDQPGADPGAPAEGGDPDNGVFVN